jgi:hypothetical protein
MFHHLLDKNQQKIKIKINRCSPLITRGKWTNEKLEAMDAVKNGTISLKRANRQRNIPLTSLSDHLYHKTRTREPRPISILTLEEN